ncbi:hypothetical protein AGMMS49975_29950 [Clostridia bacterium]|nr:hypothetical protein AGMMS49975_29950 [Clostridia bacterium]
MSRFNSRGLRGSTFEEMVNQTNEAYRKHGLALVQKIPTPIVPTRLDSERRIIMGYFEKKSTLDYIGVAQGVPICFDAKETSRKSLPLQNIHEHQIAFMEDFVRQDGAAFFLVNFKSLGECYFLPFEVLGQCTGKSVPYDKFEKRFLISNKAGFLVHYLEALALYLD